MQSDEPGRMALMVAASERLISGPIFASFPELLLQLRVFGSGLLVDRNIRVGVFPQGEKTLIGGGGSRSVTLQCVGPGKAKRGKRTQGVRDYYPSVVQDFLELRRSECPLMPT